MTGSANSRNRMDYHNFTNHFLASKDRNENFTLESDDIRRWVLKQEYNYDETAKELIEKLPSCCTSSIYGGAHWNKLSPEEITEISKQLKYDFTASHTHGFMRIDAKLNHCPKHIGCSWDINNVLDLLEDSDPKKLNFVVRPYHKIVKNVMLHPKIHHDGSVTILGSYKNVFFHVVIQV